MSRILDRSFRYTPAAETTPEYLKRKFDKEIRRIAEEKKKDDAAKAELAKKVMKFGRDPK